MADTNDYYNRFFGVLLENDPLPDDSIPAGERGPAIAGLAQAHATLAAQLLFNLMPDVELTKDRLQEVAGAGLAAMRDKLRTYRAAMN
jgi:hypothetical protein